MIDPLDAIFGKILDEEEEEIDRDHGEHILRLASPEGQARNDLVALISQAYARRGDRV